MQTNSDFGLPQPSVLARRKTHVAGEDELATCAANTAANFSDTDNLTPRKANKGVQKNRKAGRTNGRHDVA